MRRKTLFATGALVLGALALLALWVGPAHLAGAETAKRNFSYAVAAPKGWPVIHDTRFNGDKIEPAGLRTDYWIDDITLGGGHVAGSIPRNARSDDGVTITSDWIEWKTGQAFRAALSVSVDPDWGAVILRFQRDGALSLYRRSDALIAGTLGRRATLTDYIELGRVCGNPLPDAEASGLKKARADNHMLDLATFDPAKWPDAAPSFCSE